MTRRWCWILPDGDWTNGSWKPFVPRCRAFKVVNGFHPDIMALEPEFRTFRESAIAVGRPPAETLLKVGKGRLQQRIVDRRFRSNLIG